MTLTIDRDINEALARASSAMIRERDSGRAALMICAVSSPVGLLLLGSQEGALVLLEFLEPDEVDRDLVRLRERFGDVVHTGGDAITAQAVDQLEQYFAGARREFDLPLKYRGSDFQEKVWAELRRISYGSTCSYGAIAQRVGDPGAMRAVGAANHHNPIAIVIPCHRVVNANGDLGGYGGGLWRKRWLLDLESGQQQLSL
jgi:AraC family transcriptional regulator of adaptative response/methylated-DNA-[protein]-cysteine methyltransferase